MAEKLTSLALVLQKLFVSFSLFLSVFLILFSSFSTCSVRGDTLGLKGRGAFIVTCSALRWEATGAAARGVLCCPPLGTDPDRL